MKIEIDDVRALRPEAAPLAPEWSDRVVSSILAEPLAPERRRPSGRHRFAAAALACSLVGVAGTGVAAATGVWGSATFSEAFEAWKSWPDGEASDPLAAARRASAPGPEGTVFSVLTTGEDGQGCRTAVFESAESAAQPVPTEFSAAFGDWCAGAASSGDFGVVGVDTGAMADGYVVAAGPAVRATVTTRDGRTFPALLVGGDFWGWIPRGSHATVVGYAADGSVVGRVVL